MIRLARYLKPYLLMILVTIALLFVQANCDLALPDYMSKIVNNGIQQRGVSNAIPQAIRKSELDKVVLFVSDTDKDRLFGNYTLVQPGSANYDQYLKVYPQLAKEPVYILNSLSAAETTWMEPVIARGLLAVSGIEQGLSQAGSSTTTRTTTSTSAECKSFYENMGKFMGSGSQSQPADLNTTFAMIAKLPAEQRQVMQKCMSEQFSALGENMVNQAAMQVVKSEYTTLGMSTETLQRNYILQTGGLMLLIALLSVICTIAVGFLSARTAAGVARDLRKGVFEKVENFSSTEFDHFSTASLITRSTNDITQIQMVVIMMMRMVFYAPIMGVGGIIRAVNKDSSMWWLIAVAVGTLIGLIITIFSLSLPRFKKIQALIDRLNLVVRENLSGMMVIRSFNMQPFEEKRFDQANVDLTNTNLFVSRVMATMFPSMMVIMNALSLAIIWVGAHQVAAAKMQVGDMMAFLQYAMQIVFSFLMMSFMFIILPRASVSAGRISEVLDVEPVIHDPKAAKRFPEPFKGIIEFRNVSFRYPGAEEDVLHDISFTAKPGQTTAFIGSTGSGKSTIVNLLPRFYDINAGTILVDDTDIREVSQHDLRARIGYIPQKATLFTGTIESNLRYADENAEQSTLDESIEIAQAAEFITTRPEGITADISQGGANVSGGQKQRLSIARALVKHAPIYIFDDSFSALDFTTDAALRRALKERIAANTTLLIVTQRVSTIKTAEQIIVVDEGKIVGKGTHSELMTACETYREIALSQLSVEELA
jgi:ATP-binding cassette, subfamily B, multidrug efflux pump